MGTVSSPILIGRAAELARLLEAVERAADGRPQLALVTGEAGIGKSRLVAELVASVRMAGSRVLSGGCLDIGAAAVPYLPLAEALRGLARSLSPDELAAVLGPTREDLAAIAPELGSPGIAAPDTTAGSVGQARLFERVLQLVGRLAEDRSLLLVVEDVHWIDRGTRDLLTFLVRNLTGERILAVLTVRTEDLPAGHPNLAWAAELSRAPGSLRVPLQALDRSQTAEQVAAITGDDVPSPVLVDRIWRRSEGNPFFAEELLAVDGEWHAAGSPAGTLTEILLGRLAILEEDARAVVGAVAVAGRSIDDRLLAEVLDRPVEAIRPALRDAVARHVLREEPSGELMIRHELLREVVERGLLAGERRSLHERFATVLSAKPEFADPSPAGAAAELARHWAAAGRVREAYAASIAAARAAEAVHAYADAFREFERARSLEDDLRPDEQPTPADRLDLRRRAAETADLAGELDRAIALAREALAMAEEAGDVVVMAVIHARLGYLRWAVGDPAGGLEHHRTAVRLVPEDPPTPERARVLGGLAGSLMVPGGYEESAALARAAIDCARAAGAIAEEARARNVLGFDLVALGRPEAGLVELRQSRDLARAGGPTDMLVVAHYNLGLNLVEAGRLDEALAEAQAGRDVARSVGLERRFGFDLAALEGHVLLGLGRWSEAETVTTDALRLDQAGHGSAFVSAVRGRLDALRGDPVAASRRLQAAMDLGAGDDPDTAAYVASGRAELELAEDRPDDALATVEQALESGAASHALFVRVPLLALGLRATADLAERARAGRDASGWEDAGRRAERLSTDLERVAASTAAEATAVLVELARAERARADAVAAEGTRVDPAIGGAGPDRWIALAESLDAVGDRYLAAYARWRAAEAELRARGTRGEAEPLLRAAHATAKDLGAEPLRRQLVSLARRARVVLDPAADVSAPGTAAGAGAHTAAAGARAADAPDDGGHPADDTEALRRWGLSAREIEVLRLVAAGRTNGQIAERLFITRKTAGVHVTHILDKLGVSNRVEAAMVAARLGLKPGLEDG